MDFSKDLDITKSLDIVEKLKCGILSDVAALFEAIWESDPQVSTDDVANTSALLIAKVYLICQRMGIPPANVEKKMKDALRLKMINADKQEEYYQEISGLLAYISQKNKMGNLGDQL